MIRRFVISLCLAFALVLPAAAQDAEIEAVISNQITAFQKDNFPEAFSYASPNIKRMFSNANNFSQMVTRGYPMVHRPRSYTFQELSNNGPFIIQEVLIEDMQGRFYKAQYAMVKTADGWKIDGVQIIETKDVGA